METVYPDWKVGDKVRAIKDIVFTDRTRHNIGDILTITERDISYYLVNHKSYEKVS